MGVDSHLAIAERRLPENQTVLALLRDPKGGVTRAGAFLGGYVRVAGENSPTQAGALTPELRRDLDHTKFQLGPILMGEYGWGGTFSSFPVLTAIFPERDQLKITDPADPNKHLGPRELALVIRTFNQAFGGIKRSTMGRELSGQAQLAAVDLAFDIAGLNAVYLRTARDHKIVPSDLPSRLVKEVESLYEDSDSINEINALEDPGELNAIYRPVSIKEYTAAEDSGIRTAQAVATMQAARELISRFAKIAALPGENIISLENDLISVLRHDLQVPEGTWDLLNPGSVPAKAFSAMVYENGLAAQIPQNPQPSERDYREAHLEAAGRIQQLGFHYTQQAAAQRAGAKYVGPIRAANQEKRNMAAAIWQETERMKQTPLKSK